MHNLKKGEMLALTLRQPWAHCITHLGKRVENRTWWPQPELLNSRFAIHAGKGIDPSEWLSAAAIVPELNKIPLNSVPYGAVVATVRLAGYVIVRNGEIVQRTGAASRSYVPSDDRWFFGPVAWLLDDVEVLPEPFLCPGFQKLWRLKMPAQKQEGRL